MELELGAVSSMLFWAPCMIIVAMRSVAA